MYRSHARARTYAWTYAYRYVNPLKVIYLQLHVWTGPCRWVDLSYMNMTAMLITFHRFTPRLHLAQRRHTRWRWWDETYKVSRRTVRLYVSGSWHSLRVTLYETISSWRVWNLRFSRRSYDRNNGPRLKRTEDRFGYIVRNIRVNISRQRGCMCVHKHKHT